MKRLKRGQIQNWNLRWRVSRKTKLYFIGRKMSRKALRERLSAVVITDNGLSDVFCPRCGCDAVHVSSNMAPWPEVWYVEHCGRCGYKVATQDNGPWRHVLQDMVDGLKPNGGDEA
ncbi:MAG: hypothetical protein K6T83_08165 [Alicyclobacillus sp.]|nr:hypothetical protein [Alicyclobacillus sp.]